MLKLLPVTMYIVSFAIILFILSDLGTHDGAETLGKCNECISFRKPSSLHGVKLGGRVLGSHCMQYHNVNISVTQVYAFYMHL